MLDIVQQLASELNAGTQQIEAAISLMDDGATVPFIARYRKEATGGLDDIQLRKLAQRLVYIRELTDRKSVILKSISEQGKLTAALSQAIEDADSKTLLEDLYLPFKAKRRTKGFLAIEAGIEPLVDLLLQDRNLDPASAAQNYLNIELNFATSEDVLEGARAILVERFAEDAKLIKQLREWLISKAFLYSSVVKDKQKEGSKFKDYFDYAEKLVNVPSHRALAMLRGRNEGFLSIKLGPSPDADKHKLNEQCEHIIKQHYDLRLGNRPVDGWLETVVQQCWKKKLGLSLETEQLSQLKERAETEAISVFAKNLHDVLMAAPAGPRTTMGLDPGLRTGVKIAIVDQTGKYCEHATIFPHAPQNHWEKSLRTLSQLCRQHKVELIAIGNGTASRETDKLAAELIKANPELNLNKVMVSEAGASVYSASEYASLEFPDIDVSIRGAISIARRLQDPQAELVKIDAKAIGVGQYQHDVNQNQLINALTSVVEDCVNAVGVNLNMASVPLLSRVSGLNKTLAQNIVNFRDEFGAFINREQLKKVTRLGPKAYEQCAGFLRISNGENPLDASGVHPESYRIVEQVLAQLQMGLSDLVGNSQILKSLDPVAFTSQQFGLPTVTDIIAELDKPGRDPRGEFKTAQFKEGVETINDLVVGMKLQGVVSNVANFGAFVDIGVHQDGLVHISALTDKFIADPREVVKAGDIVMVKVIEVDPARKRINLTMRLNDPINPPENGARGQHSAGSESTGAKKPRNGKSQGGKPPASQPKAKAPQNAVMGNAFADAFAKLKQ